MRAMAWVTVALASACVVGGGERTVVQDDVAGLRIELGNGEIDLVDLATAGRTTTVHLELGGIGPRAARGETYVDADGWLVIDAGGALGGGEIEATVPPGLPVELFVDRGEVTVQRRVVGDVLACVGAGELTVEVPEGPYRLDLDGGAGSVVSVGVWDAPDAEAALSLCVGAGDLSVVGMP